MWIENKVFKEDLDYIINTQFIDWDKLNNKTVFVTGSTGLIGYSFVCALLYRNLLKHSGIKIIALVRNVDKARAMYEGAIKTGLVIDFVQGSLENFCELTSQIDYIMHAASPTASKYFVENPVETIKTTVAGMNSVLELARAKKVSGAVYLSSMEVYGAPLNDEVIKESQGTTVDTMSVRSCYPEVKRLCEALCASYADEYGIPVNVLRLAQTFGPGVKAGDNRVFAEFARCAMNGHDIILQTEGTSRRCYLYVADAVTAILSIMLSDAKGEAFNAANPKTYCSIVEMAEIVARGVASNAINVTFSISEQGKRKFSPPHHLNLSVEKLTSMGWKETYELATMYIRMIECMK